jgi:uncharacterized protein YegP (UPF0339 family)
LAQAKEHDMARTLAQFTITPDSDGDYTLHLEDDDGETIEFTASYEQLDLVVEAIEEVLDSDEDDSLGVDEDEDAAENVEE